MSKNQAASLHGVLLTSDHIRRWEGDLARIDSEIHTLGLTRISVTKKIEAARVLLDLVADENLTLPINNSEFLGPSIVNDDDASDDAASVTRIVKRKRRPSGKVTWTDIIQKIVTSSEIGLTYAEVRAQAIASELGNRLKESDKGYHNAIGRLARDGAIVREHGRLFTHKAFERFKVAVDAGQATTIVAMPLAHSPMGEAILKIVHASPGMVGKQIIMELRKDVEFNATLTPHETGAYNIIARLVKRRQIIRRDDGGIIPGPDFPKDLIGQASNEVGALSGMTASAPLIREAATSLFDEDAKSVL